MVVEIRSDEFIHGDTINKIRNILEESECPNESLSKSIRNFTSYNGDRIVQLGKNDNYVVYIYIDK